jgi:benzoyl-CoA reductase/2-hydroxyglutaryl-CoA dehydratase subunit BcrC/BadD/HgdB
MPDLFTVIERAGGLVVMDDLCTGTRFFEGSIEPEENIFRAIARRYHGRIVCPSKHTGIRSRGEALVKMVKQSRAHGVMFFCLKFCDPFGFDYPYIKELLDGEGVPSMLFELEDASALDGQFQTRCEAFLEML